MKKTVSLSFAATMLVTTFTACKTNETKTAPVPAMNNTDTVAIDAPGLQQKLQLAAVTEEPYEIRLATAGTVRAIPTQFAEIAPAFKGRVTKAYLKLGMKTVPETPLFEVSSPDFIAAQKIFFQERSQLDQAQKNLQRQKDLVAHGVGVQKDLEEAETAYEVEKKEYENAVAGIKIFKTDPAKLTLGQPLVVTSPIAGEVIINKVVLGQFINDDATSVATVANLQKIWIAAQVKEKDIMHIHSLKECTVAIAALPEKMIRGKVCHVNDIVDEATRSVEVLIEADNTDHLLKPGMYVTVDFHCPDGSKIMIPTKAILQMNDASFVFVETAAHKYARRTIVTGECRGDKTLVQSGLAPGEKIITQGGVYLLSAQ